MSDLRFIKLEKWEPRPTVWDRVEVWILRAVLCGFAAVAVRVAWGLLP